MGGLKAMNALRLMAFPARQYIPLSTNIILLHPCNGGNRCKAHKKLTTAIADVILYLYCFLVLHCFLKRPPLHATGMGLKRLNFSGATF
jgi:hypothetical protein